MKCMTHPCAYIPILAPTHPILRERIGNSYVAHTERGYDLYSLAWRKLQNTSSVYSKRDYPESINCFAIYTIHRFKQGFEPSALDL